MKTPFTQTNYPQGYSRKDCQDQLDTVESQIRDTKERLKRLSAEAKELRKALKQGGRTD